MTQKIFRSTIFVAAVVLLCSLSIIMGALYSYFSGVQVAQLREELELAAIGAERYGADYLEQISGGFRITWVAEDGTVLFDTQVTAGELENHADREEIAEARSTGSGSSARYSDTLMERTLYEALRLGDGSVLRISASQASVGGLLLDMLQYIIIVAVIAILVCLLLAHRMSRKIVEPLNELDLEHPLQNDIYEEITPLLQRIDQQHLQIDDHLRKLRRKTDEFEQITNNMQEGLVVLDKQTRIRSINPTAQRIFRTDESCVGTSLLAVSNSLRLRQAINDALDTGRGTAAMEIDGREYRFDMNSIRSEGKLLGAVVLVLDMTEERNAERSRREFSANVSHELKTPLQSIIGSAELMENGLVKPEDTPRFIGHIRKEAARLVNLVEDIIRLSQLDEGAAVPTEEVELLAIAEEVVQGLKPAAAGKNVTVQVSGQPCHITGVRRLLYEIIYNLCDNAIKYNKEGGTVSVRVEDRVLKVRDTGIGIPPEHKDRVFQRFYRVDKSHSKQSGGTGLGLSIVKHAVQFHNAELELESTPGIGTEVTVRF